MITEGEARYIASLWHGGQNSSLYAFCSSGHIDDFIEIEIENCLTQATRHSREDSTDVGELIELLEYIQRGGKE